MSGLPALPPVRFTQLTVERLTTLPGGSVEAHLRGALPKARPGQFLMVEADPAEVLLRPYSVFRTLEEDVRTVLLRGRVPPAFLPHARVSVLGPLGRPFPSPADLVQEGSLCGSGAAAGRLLCLVEEGRLPALYAAVREHAAEALDCGGSVELFVAGTQAAHFDGLAYLADAPVAIHRATDREAALTALVETLTPVDGVFAAVPEASLRALDRALAERPSPAFVYVAVESAMACGVGACFGCPIRLRHPADARHPYVRACTEGPVLPLAEVAV